MWFPSWICKQHYNSCTSSTSCLQFSIAGLNIFYYLHWTCDTTSAFFFLQCWLPAKRKRDHNLRSNETHAGTQQTTLSRLSLADRAWETDDDESLMLSTPITNKTRARTHTHHMHADTHLGPLSCSSALSHFTAWCFSPCHRRFRGDRDRWRDREGNGSTAEEEKSPSAFHSGLK